MKKRGLTGALDVDKIDIVGGCVDHGPECHRVGDLTVEPDVFVGGEEPGELGTDDTDDVAQHGEQNEAAIEGEDETGATGYPDGVFEGVQASKTSISELLASEKPATSTRSAPESTIHMQTRINGCRRRAR